MRKINLETAVGLFILIGIISLGYLSIRMGKLEVIGAKGTTLFAEFGAVAGIKPGAAVEIAGVGVGKVKSIRLKDYQATMELFILGDLKIQEDAIASVKTKGLIGEKYVEIAPGASEKFIPDGGRIRETESAIDYESLISKFIFGKV
ncbi:MAG: outer membrane lipid asymmetry maintenance protein MlaD [Nitrospiraceae bacterium]|nr:outer membrane lipid asymmetry maintenance protein MlaD [Nitrospiraceae bacterium]